VAGAALMLCALLLAGPPEMSFAETPHEKARAMEPEQQVDYLRGLQREGDHSAELHFLMGNAFYSLEQIDSSIFHLDMATKIDTAYSKAWVNLGIAYETGHRSRDARAAFQRAIEVNPEDVLAHCHLGFNYFEAGDVDRAVKLYVRALEIDENSAQAHYNLGLAFADARLFNEALAEWNRVVEIDPDGDLGRIAAENVDLIKTYLDLKE